MRLRTLILASAALALSFACGKTPEPEPKPEPKPSTVAVTSVSLNKSSLTLEPGGSETLTATVAPSNATDKTVTWSTSNSGVATVENGKVTAVKEGEATITSKAGGKEASCKVTVKKAVIAVESVTLNKTELTLEPGATETLIATVAPENATDKTVTWSTSNAEVAIVENGKVTAVKEGEATITAKAGEKEATCKVVVKGPPSISVSVSAMTFLSNGGTKELTVSCRGDWTLSGYPSWCVPSMTSGTGDATIVLTVSKNTEQQRSAQLSFSCSGEVVSVLITQTGEGWQNQRFVHKSLYMMFTSVHCGWSLYMNQNIQKADQKVGDKYVRVDVHGRGISNPLPESPIDFSEAHVLYGLFYAGIPSGVLDSRVRVRNWSDRDAHLVPETFVSAIKQQEEVYPAGTGIAFSSSLSGNVLKVEGKVYSHIAESMKLTVYLLEDAIQGESLGYDGYYSDRQYDNVLRLALSNVMGDSIHFENKNSVKDFKYSITIPEGYNRDNLSILVFVQREYGNVIVRDEYMGDYYIDNCRKANVGREAKLELYENSSGGGNEGISVGDEITF